MQNVDLTGGIWISLSELARRENIARSSAKEHVDRFEAKGLLETRRQGRERVVNLAAYYHAAGTAGDLAKEVVAADRRSAPMTTGGAYRDAQTERAQYDAQLKALELAERRRQLVPIAGPHGVEMAASELGAAMAAIMDTLPSHSDHLTSVAKSGGVSALRTALREIGRGMRARAAEELLKLAAVGRQAEAAGPIVTDLFANTPHDATPSTAD